MILKLHYINFNARETLFFLNNVNIDNILVPKNISPGTKNYKYFVGYLVEYKIKTLNIILPKTKVYYVILLTEENALNKIKIKKQ